MYPNKKAMGPVAYKGNQWVGYDDIDIVKRKAEYVAENGLGGRQIFVYHNLVFGYNFTWGVTHWLPQQRNYRQPIEASTA